MIELECPKCEGPIEFTFAADEDWAHRPCAEIDEIVKECGCKLDVGEWEALEEMALRLVDEQ